MLVNVDDIKAVLAAAREELAEYAETADARMVTLDQKATEARTDIDAAVSRQGELEIILEPLPGQVEAAEKNVEIATNAAIAAEARATEANNRAMTRLANGNFEAGLQYWTGNAVLADEGHSGSHSALIGSVGDGITPESFMPVVEGQIWELQYYFKAANDAAVGAQIVAALMDESGAYVSGYWRNTESTMDWQDSGALRYTLPADVNMVRPRIFRSGLATKAAHFLIDDVVLRDVTDVVRLEIAAQEAKKAGTDAQSTAAALQLRVDGVDTRLEAAEGRTEAVAGEAAEALSDLDAALTQAFQQGDTAAKNAAIQAAASDATTKANNARTAAEAEAKRLAEAEAAAAQSAAEATAAADAKTKADKALADAKLDATSKSGAAQTAAEAEAKRLATAAENAAKAAAAADAKAKADAAQAEAIKQAKADATTKADAAQAEALRLAKLDATAKADAAKSGAISAAAADAQEKFDAAMSAAVEAYKSTENMVANGSFEQGWTGWNREHSGGTVDTSVSRSGGSSFRTNNNGAASQAEFPVQAGQIWRYSWWYKTEAGFISGTPGGLRLRGKGAAGVLTDVASTAMTESLDWKHQAVEYVVPANVTHLAARFAFAMGSTQKNIWVDDLELKNVTDVKRLEQAALAAQNRADSAHGEAGKAWNHADAAMDAAATAKSDAIKHADSLPKVLHGTAGPSGTAPNGSIWWQHQSTLSGRVIGQWNRVNNAWVSTPIDSAAIANLDVGKLTAGSAEVAELVTQKLLANQAIINRLTVGIQAWISGVLIKDGAIDASKITVTDELITDIFGANRALIEDELVVQGSLFANNATLISAAMKTLSVTEKAQFADAYADQLYAAMAVIERLQATEAWIGGTLLKDGAVTTDKMTVTETLWAALGQFVEITAGMIKANAFEGQTFTGGRFVGALFETLAAANRGLKWDGQGIRSFDPNGNLMLHFDSATGKLIVGPNGIIEGGKIQTTPVPSDHVVGAHNSVYMNTNGISVGTAGAQSGDALWYVSARDGHMWAAEAQIDRLVGGLALEGPAYSYAADGNWNMPQPVESEAQLTTKAYVDKQAGGQWAFIPLRNGWTAFGQGYAGPQWRREGKTVRLRGVLSGAMATTAMSVLPAEARPTYPQLLNVRAWTAQTAPYRLNIATDGTMSQTGLTTVPSWISLDGVTYPID
ncbi:hypothetical protein [Citricoccus sp. K5]|uniref:hypothetical protein n=1 Tax=Citricoccus sp. K5 TaxID=2653135 RepID=UPI001358B490|nr:hypothetical protein [Citricoccus sp. K5]